MKNIFNVTIFFLLILFTTDCAAQSYGWFTQTSGTTNNLNGVWFANTNTGYTVGNAGTILKTVNGGTNWTTQSSGTPNHLFGVYFLNINTGWAAGDVGIVLKTTNGGTNWVIQVSNTIYQLHHISFINSSTGYICGWYGTIIKTTNGGSGWVVLASGTTNNLHAVTFPNSSTGYAVGWYGAIVKTVNSGNNWYTVTSGTINSFESVSFTDMYTGFALGEGGRVQKTTNGGANWVTQTSGTGNWLNSISSPEPVATTIAGENGTIRKTSNGGLNWLSQTSNTSNWLKGVSFTDTLNGWAVGSNGTIIHTTTGGWLLPSTPSLSVPGNNSTCISLTATLDWGDVFPPVCNYRIQISLASNFNTTVKDTSALMVSQYQIPSGLLSYFTKYYWRVAAANQVGTGSWSSTRNFTTTYAIPSAPDLSSPPNNSVGQTLTPLFDWDSASSALTYRLRVSLDSVFTSSLIDTSGLTVTQFQMPAGILQNNNKYYWAVNGINTCVTGELSEVWNFSTLITGIGKNETGIPKEFRLYMNYPNPFNPVTVIKYDLPEDAYVFLKIYDLLGEEVAVPVNEFKKAGSYNETIDASNLPSGVYFYKLSAGKYTDSKKMVLLK
jgi:photosystem II stability/assembly factor-like uncharacterized protein